MTALNHQSNWPNQHGFDHWLKHSIIPMTLVMLVLLMPKPWSVYNDFNSVPLIIELTPTDPVTDQIIELEEPPIIEPIIEPKEPEPIEPETEEPSPAQPVQQTEQQQQLTLEKNQPISSPTDTQPDAVQETQQQPSAIELMNQIDNRTAVEITEEFMPRTGAAKSYFETQPEVTDWYADIPYLDESVDRPQVQMRFYAEGLEGSIERFFDKITVSKTFTSKYGTKIHCAWVGILAACSWK